MIATLEPKYVYKAHVTFHQTETAHMGILEMLNRFLNLCFPYVGVATACFFLSFSFWSGLVNCAWSETGISTASRGVCIQSFNTNSNAWAETLAYREPSPDTARGSALRARSGGLPLRSSSPLELGGELLPLASAGNIETIQPSKVRTTRFQALRQQPPLARPLSRRLRCEAGRGSSGVSGHAAV